MRSTLNPAVVETVHDDPSVTWSALGTLANQRRDLIEGKFLVAQGAVVECESAIHQVNVRVDQAGQHGDALESQHARVLADPVLRARVVAHVRDLAVTNRQRLRLRLRRIHRDDARFEDDQVRDFRLRLARTG